MIPIDVDNPIAEWAGVLLIKNPNPQPSLDHCFEEQWVYVVVRSFRGKGVEPAASTFSACELKVCLAVGVGGPWCFEAFPGGVVESSRKLALSWRVVEWCSEAVGVHNVVVVGGECVGGG